MDKKYRIPTIDEFKQGFKFQRLEHLKGTKIGGIWFMDLEFNSKYGRGLFAEKDSWYDFKVWWDRKPETKTTVHDGISYTWTEFPAFDWLPWIEEGYIQKLIDDGKVRCKC